MKLAREEVKETWLNEKERTLTSILTSNEIDPIAEFNLQAAVAHEILDLYFWYDPGTMPSCH